MIRWFCVMHAVWAAVPNVSDAEIDAGQSLPAAKDVDVFAAWLRSVSARVMPLLCPANVSSDWFFQGFKMFNEFLPTGDGDYIRSRCSYLGGLKAAECSRHVDCLSATKAQCDNEKCAVCSANAHCERFEHTNICKDGACVATPVTLDATAPVSSSTIKPAERECKDNDAGLAELWGSYTCTNSVEYCASYIEDMNMHCPKICGFCGPLTPRALKLSADDLIEILEHVNTVTRTAAHKDTEGFVNQLSTLQLMRVQAENITFSKTNTWLLASQSENKRRLSITISNVEVDADTKMLAKTSMVPLGALTTLSKLEMNITNVTIDFPLPSLKMQQGNYLRLDLAADEDIVCRASHEPLPDVRLDFPDLPVFASSFANTIAGLFLADGLKLDMKRMIVQTLEDSCSFAGRLYRSALTKASDMLDTWQNIIIPPYSNSDWSASKSEFVRKARFLSGVVTDPRSPVSLTKLLAAVNKETLIQMVQGRPETKIAYPFGHEKISLGPELLGKFGSANVALVEVQLYGLSSLEDIKMKLEDNSASVQLMGTFGMNITVELEFELKEMDADVITYPALGKMKRQYQVSVKDVVNPSFGIDFGVVASLADLDDALEAAFSPANLLKIFNQMDTDKDIVSQVRNTLADVTSSIVKHLGSGSELGFKISKINFDADAIKRVHVISVGKDCASFENLELFDQIICGVMEVAEIIYASLFNDDPDVLPRLVNTMLREPAVMKVVNAFVSESIASAKTRVADYPEEPSTVSRARESEHNDIGAPPPQTAQFDPLSLMRYLTNDTKNKTVLLLPALSVARGHLSVKPTLEAAKAMVMTPWALRPLGDNDANRAYMRVRMSNSGDVMTIKGQNMATRVHAYNVTVRADIDGALMNTPTRFSVSSPHVGLDVVVKSVDLTLGASSRTQQVADIELHNIVMSSDGAAQTDETFVLDLLEKSAYVKEAVSCVFAFARDQFLLTLPSEHSRRSLSSSLPPAMSPPLSNGLALSDAFAVLLTLRDQFQDLYKELSLNAWHRARDMVQSWIRVQLDLPVRTTEDGSALRVSNVTITDNVTDIIVSNAATATKAVRVQLKGTVMISFTATASASEDRPNDGSRSDTLTLEVTNGAFELAGTLNEKVDLTSMLDALWTAIVEEKKPCVSNVSGNGDLLTVSHVDVLCDSVTASDSRAILDFAATDGVSFKKFLTLLDSSVTVTRAPSLLGLLNSHLNALLKVHTSRCAPRHDPITIDAWSGGRQQSMVRWSNASLVNFADEVLTRIVGPPHATWDEWNLNNVTHFPYKTKHWLQISAPLQHGPFDFLEHRWQMDMAPLMVYSWDRPGYYKIKGVRTVRVDETNIESAIRVLAPRLIATNSEWIVNGSGVVSTDFPVSPGDRLIQIRTIAVPHKQITASDEESVENALAAFGSGPYDLIFATPWPALRTVNPRGVQINATIEEIQINHVDSGTNFEAPLVHMGEDVFLTQRNVSSWFAYAQKKSSGENRRAIEMTEVLPDDTWVRVRIPSTTPLVVVQNSRYKHANGVYVPASDKPRGVWHNGRKWEYNSTSQRLQGMHKGKAVDEAVTAQLERSKLMPTAVTLPARLSSAHSFRVHVDDRTVLEYTSSSASNMACINVREGDVTRGLGCDLAYEGAEFRLVKNSSKVEVRAVASENSSTLRSIFTTRTLHAMPYVEITSANTVVEVVAPGYKGAWDSLSATDTMLGVSMAFDMLEPRIKVHLSVRERPEVPPRDSVIEFSAHVSKVTTDVRVIVQALATQLTVDEFLSGPCLLGTIGNLTRVHDVALAASWQNFTLRVDERAATIDSTNFMQQMCDAFGRLVVSKFLLPTINARIAHELKSTAKTCPTPAWHAPQPFVSDIFKWIGVALLCLGCVVFVVGWGLRVIMKSPHAGKDKSVDNAVPASSNMLRSLHAHHALPQYAKMAFPVFLIAVACGLMSSYVHAGAIARFGMQTEDFFGPRITASIPNFFALTFMGTVTDMWKATAYPIAFAVFVCSTILPLGKLVAMGACWYVTPRHARWVTRRRQMIVLLNFYSKWALLDFFVAVIFVACLRQRIALPPTSSVREAHRQSPDVDDQHSVRGHIDYSAETAYGFYAFFFSLVFSQIVGYVLASYDVQAARKDVIMHTDSASTTKRRSLPHSVPEADTASAPQAIAVMYHASVRERSAHTRNVASMDGNARAESWVARCMAHGQQAWQAYERVESVVLCVLLLVSCVLVSLGVFFKVVTFEVRGMAGWLSTGLDVTSDNGHASAKYHEKHMSVWDIAIEQIAPAEHEKTFAMYMNMVVILLLTLIGPLLCLCSLMLVWSVPMGARARQATYAATRALETLNNFDVFTFTLIATTVQFRLLMLQIIGDRCDLVNPFLAQMFGNILSPAECVAGEVTFLPPIYFNACTAILVAGVGYRVRVLIARTIALDRSACAVRQGRGPIDKSTDTKSEDFRANKVEETSEDV